MGVLQGKLDRIQKITPTVNQVVGSVNSILSRPESPKPLPAVVDEIPRMARKALDTLESEKSKKSDDLGNLARKALDSLDSLDSKKSDDIGNLARKALDSFNSK